MADNTKGNPWKGLNYYVEGEILYGRDAEILSLSQYIFNNTQTVLYGRSGIGKSSILNAGIFPEARRRGMVPVGIRLKHDEADDYLVQIRAALANSGLRPEPIVPAVDGEENETLWEFIHRHHFLNEEGERCVPLFVFDQFEEIFTLQKNERLKRGFFKQLGDLFNDVKPEYIVENESLHRQQMLEATQDTKVVSSGTFKGMNLRLNIRRSDADRTYVPRYIERPDYHIVFALREDFLSSLELYASTIPVMKDNRFGLLPINEEQAADIIRLPCPGLVDDNVTALIIQQVTGRTDFILDGIPEIEVDAAVLSLFLSRLYTKKSSADPCITADLVHTYSGHIIHDFYVESVTSDQENGEIITEESILLLEDQLLTREGRRNNVSRSDLIASGVKENELDTLIYTRKLLRQFHHGNDIRIEFIHDILCPVVKERKEQRELLRQQQLERLRQEEEKAKIIKEAEQRARRIKRRNRRILIWVASILLLIILGGAYYWHIKIYLPNKEHVKYYSRFELVNGWPVGVNELSDAERRHTPLYYRLSHIGEGENDTDVEVCSSNSMLPADERITNWPEICKNEGDVKGSEFNDVLRKVKKIHFVASENGKVEKMELRDSNDKLMMLMNYFHLNDNEAWIHYMTAKGQSMNIRDNGIDRVKLSWDSLGRIEYLRYYTSAGVAKPIQEINNIGGFYRNYPPDSPGTIEYFTLNTYGLPVTDATYNMKRVTTKGDSVITSYHKVVMLGDTNPKEAIGDDGYSRHEYSKTGSDVSIEQLYSPGSSEPIAICKTEYDDHGNSIRQTIDGVTNNNLPPLIKWSYKGDTGLMSGKEYLTADGKPYGSKDDVCRWEFKYGDDGSRVYERRFSTSGDVLYSYDRAETSSGGIRIVKVTEEDITAGRSLTVIDSVSSGRRSTSFFGKGDRKINRPVWFMEEDSVLCHYCVEDTLENVITRRFFVSDDDGEVSPVDTRIDPGTFRATAFCITEVTDENGNRERMEIKDGEGKIIKRMMYFIQNGKPVGRAVWGLDDKPVRCPEWEEEGFGYYTMYFTKDFDNSYMNLQTFDEWMNNSVFLFSAEDYQTVRPLELRGKTVWLDRVNDSWVQIPSTKSVTVSQFDKDQAVSGLSMPFLHILSKDCVLYRLGLRDGDRVVKLGSWALGESESKFAGEWGRLNEAEVEIEVLRPIGSGLKKEVFHVPVNPDVSVASECHFMKLSNDEKKYYENNVL